MRVSDLSRILKGASLVIDQIVLRSRPEVAWRLKRATFHLSELFKVVVEITSDAQRNVKDKANVHYEKGNVDAEDGTFATESAGGTASSGPPTSAAPPEEVDPIGFSKISNTEDDPKYGEDLLSNASKAKNMHERAVPSTQLGRMVGFGSLAFRMAMGEAMDRASHAISGNSGPRHISDENAERLAESLCRMRGAALKLGQMLSLQDDTALPPSLSKALERVKQSADYMPKRQLNAQLVSQLGEDWRSKLLEFDDVPIAAASIGQVHRAKLLDGTEVAMKIQYPGVAESIDSDLNNLKRLVQVTNLLPPGLFVDKIIEVASVELKAECRSLFLLGNAVSVTVPHLPNRIITGDYQLEAESQTRYRDLVLNDPVLRKHCNVPEVFPELSTSRVLTSRLVRGSPIDAAGLLPQSVRNAVARTVLIVTIRELFEWRFIQSDPNYANFLYDHPHRTINMIDFGAARQYGKDFVDGYMELVWAAANRDSDTILKVSKDLGFLTGRVACVIAHGLSGLFVTVNNRMPCDDTGDETQEFTDAHVSAGLVVGEPFLHAEAFDFGNSQLTTRLGSYGGTFMKYRLTPPPTEAYSLHRKLAGAFLLCIKLKANIPCRDILEETYRKYKFGPV